MADLRMENLEKIKRPREKILRYGFARLKLEELLAVILGTGRRGKNVVGLSLEILRKIESGGEIDLVRLTSIKGVGEVKAMKVLCVLELAKRLCVDVDEKRVFDSEDVWREMREYWQKRKEYFVGFYLDVSGKVLLKEVVSVGCLDMSVVHPREVFEPAVRLNAATVIVAHNHPSGQLQPSQADIDVTKRLRLAGDILGIELLDHVIVSQKGFWSMETEGEW